MQHASVGDWESPIAEPRRLFPTQGDAALAARHLRRTRQIQALLALGALPLVFTAWVILSRALELDVIFAARAAWLTALPILVLVIFAPLFLPYPWEIRWRGYALQWFLFSSFWILIWEAPLVVSRSAFEGVARTQANLPYYIFWWGYLSSDLDYAAMTPFFHLSELSWWVILIPVAIALLQLWRGREVSAFLLLGVCGALQFYNVGYFMAYGGIVEGFANVATDSILAPLLYWGLNGLWGVAGGVASVASFQCLFRIIRNPGSASAARGTRG